MIDQRRAANTFHHVGRVRQWPATAAEYKNEPKVHRQPAHDDDANWHCAPSSWTVIAWRSAENQRARKPSGERRDVAARRGDADLEPERHDADQPRCHGRAPSPAARECTAGPRMGCNDLCMTPRMRLGAAPCLDVTWREHGDASD